MLHPTFNLFFVTFCQKTKENIADSVTAISTSSVGRQEAVLPESGKGMEHMASFDYGYKIAAVRDWLFKQSK